MYRHCRSKVNNAKVFLFLVHYCHPIPFLDNSYVIRKLTYLDNDVTLYCNDGYRFPDGQKSRTMTCDSITGIWPDLDTFICTGEYHYLYFSSLTLSYLHLMFFDTEGGGLS